jgi:hypothetical protein
MAKTGDSTDTQGALAGYWDARRECCRGNLERLAAGKGRKTTEPDLAGAGDVVEREKGVARKRHAQVTVAGRARPSYVEHRPYAVLPGRALAPRGVMRC